MPGHAILKCFVCKKTVSFSDIIMNNSFRYHSEKDKVIPETKDHFSASSKLRRKKNFALAILTMKLKVIRLLYILNVWET